ncbi:MAG: hypothetical protein M4579_006676 [Chaenotheca gracillima]|nr:MAG: hypothetical protein M4579_006676 [Chaenotheca gracillima]
MSKDASAKTKSSPYFHFVAGLFSGVSSAILLQPADLLKTRVQQSGSSSLLPTLRAIYNGPAPIRSFWRGTLPSTLRTGFGSALYFSSLNALREYAARAQLRVAAPGEVLSTAEEDASSTSTLPRLSNLANLTTGAIARGTVGLIMMPITVIKVRYESNYYAYRSLVGAGTDIFRKEGLRGFFSGFGVTALRDAPYAGIYVLFYEQSKKRLGALFPASLNAEAHPAGPPRGQYSTSPTAALNAVKNPASMAVPINFTSAALAAMLATALTNPFDAVKTRLQLFPKRYGNMASAVVTMIREDGWRSLLDGLGIRMARKAMSSALAWTVYEEVVRRGTKHWARRFEE